MLVFAVEHTVFKILNVFSKIGGLLDGIWGLDVLTGNKNDPDNDDKMVMCILLVNITDLFATELVQFRDAQYFESV